MKKFRYVGPAALPVEIPAAGVSTDDKGVVEVDDATAVGLADQDVWEPVGGSQQKKETN